MSLLKEKDKEQFLTLYAHANNEFDLLREYYKITYQNIIKDRETVEKEYEIGHKIDLLLEEVFDKSNEQLNQDKLTIIKETILFGNVRFKDIITEIESNKKSVRFTIAKKYKLDPHFNPKIARNKYKEAERYEAIFSRSIVSEIIVVFESLLSKLLFFLIINNPFPYLKEESIPLASIFLDDTFNVISEKIDAAVEQKMYDSLKTLEDIIKIEQIDIDKTTLAAFKEIYYRRNIIIHNDSKVNKKYLNSINSSFRKDLKIDDTLICSSEYIDNAFNILYELFFYVYYGVFKQYKVDTKIYMKTINYFAFKKLQDKDYNIARAIYKKISINNEIEFIDKMMFRINYLNAEKQLNMSDELLNEIKKLDVSIATDNFKIAKLCLLDDNKQIYDYLTKTYPKSFTADQIKEWPIFINFRESVEYSQFCIEHADDFSSEELIQENEEKA